jgi:WhiB family redox-sensing transcriptional regulator
VSSVLKNTENFDPIYASDIEWMSDAACLGMDVNMFFPTEGQNLSPEVKALCNSCTVRVNCYIYAEQHYIDHGTFGGMSAQQRKESRRTTGRTSPRFQEIVKL